MAAKKRSAKVRKRTPIPDVRVAKRGKKRRAKAAIAAAPSRKKAPVRKKAGRALAAVAPRAEPSVPTKKKRPSAKKSATTAPAGAPRTAVPAVAVNDRAPSFELLDQRGSSVSSNELSGHPYVLYFYPKDDTPGCTTEACAFRDALPDFERVSVRVLGVSPDSVASHQRFVGKYGLNFTLLSDPDQTLASAYGVWSLKKNYGREYMGIVRSTFLIDGGGVVRKAWRGVRVNGHIAEVQAAATELA
jgi:thioredoxin-dependent peroxiredoxin